MADAADEDTDMAAALALSRSLNAGPGTQDSGAIPPELLPSSGDHAWQCQACTLLNPASRTTCDACGNARPALPHEKPLLRLNVNAAEAPALPAEQPAAAPQLASGAAPSSSSRAAGPAAAGAGLSAEERRARQEEIAAKRQKKEEERQRILRQAKADHSAAAPTAPAEVPPAAAPAASGAAAAQPPKPQPQTARLQLRCPHWQRTVVFTCFAPGDSLGKVRACLREELLKGLGGDGREAPNMEEHRARVPPEEAIIFVESVPPRRRFASAEDMQQTLLEAGLCPSSSLLVEAPPVEPEPGTVAAAAAGEAEGVAEEPSQAEREPEEGEEEEEDGENEDEEEEESSDDEDRYGMPGGPLGGKGGGKATGSGTFGNAPRRAYGGTFGANWRFGPRNGGGAKSGPRIGEGGQILGAGTAGSGGGGSGGSGNSEEQRAAREARLAALERRAREAGAAAAAPAAVEAAPAAPTPPAAPAAVAAAAPAAEAVPAAPAPTAAPAAAAAAARAAEARAGGAPSSAASSAAAAAPRGLPASAPDRVKGQMGGGTSKAQRAMEREQILQKLEEDRSTYQLRHTPAASAAASAAAQGSSQAAVGGGAGGHSSGGSGPVRLQFRCAASGRTAVRNDFVESSTLLAVRDFAAQEFGLATCGPGAAELQLAYPPRTIFSAPEQLAASLAACGLSPSATLLVRGAVAAEEAEAETETEAEAPRNCPNGHIMQRLDVGEEMWCDKCSQGLAAGATAFECRECDYIECRACGAQA